MQDLRSQYNGLISRVSHHDQRLDRIESTLKLSSLPVDTNTSPKPVDISRSTVQPQSLIPPQRSSPNTLPVIPSPSPNSPVSRQEVEAFGNRFDSLQDTFEQMSAAILALSANRSNNSQ